MPTPPAPPRYTRTAMAFHWLMALMLVGSVVVGNYMADLPFSPQRVKLFNWHKWAGICLLTIAVLRLFWRLTHRPPPEVPMPRWQELAAQCTHAALYVLFLAVPLVGWAYSSAAGFPVVVFGVLPLPDFVPRDKALGETLEACHAWLAYTMALLVLVHVGAALKHHFIDRDGLLSRMWPRRATQAR